MKKKIYLKIISLRLFAFFMILLFLSGCIEKRIEKQTAQQDPVFEKWRILAEESKGFSPMVVKKTLNLPKERKIGVLEKKIKERDLRSLPVKKIDLKMQQVEVSTLLRTLAKAVNINIIVNENVKGKVNINVVHAAWDELFNGLLSSYGLTYVWEGKLLRILTEMDLDKEIKRSFQKNDLRMAGPLVTQIISIDYINSSNLKKNLDHFLSKDKAGKSIGSVVVDEYTNSLVIQALVDDLEAMLPLIEKLDRPTPQILIEAYIVETNKETAVELGVQWGGLYHDSSGSKGTWLTPGAKSSGINDQKLSDGGIDPTSGMGFSLPDGLLDGSGLNLGFVSEKIGAHILNVQLSALEQEGKLNILSKPSITTIDNHLAIIESGTDVPYQTVVDDDVSIEWKKATLRLEVLPHVIDNKTIRLKIVTHKDELDFSRDVDGNPVIITKNAETSIILLDGQTTVIGGLKKEKTIDTESGVPWLKDIPFFGYLFKGRHNSKEMEDLLIFITPYILKQNKTDVVSIKQ